MTQKKLEGIIAMLVTPMTKSEEIDYGALRAEIDWCAAQKTQGIVVTPSIGEFAVMTNEERWKCFEVCREQASKHPGLYTVAMTAATNSREVVRHCKVAKELGYDAMQLIPPYYWLPDEDEVYRHYQLAAETGLPVIIYHNPALSKFYMRREFVAKLATIPGVIAMKEVRTDRHVELEDLFRLLKGKIKLFTTFRAFTTGLLLGSSGGFINVFAVPACVKMWELWQEGERDRVEEIQITLNDLFPRGGEDNKKHIGTTKMVSSVVTGIEMGAPRSPYLLPEKRYRESLEKTLPELNRLLR
ncbi:MAG: dihydrodipicolinate synthase family protein [Deltaproteobacteria bacterium]|nr:dihydrodipicolinate synthase family protein [Deltaproteobacteria bacterium]